MPHLYIYSPAGAVHDRAAFNRAIKRLQAQGHEVEVDPAALAQHQRFAGDDDTRLAAIGRAAASGAHATLITRGGYGITRLLPRLPYKAIAQSIEKGTQWIGFSDFTALQLALWQKTRAATWAGPALIESFGAPQPAAGQGAAVDEITQACFDDVISGQSEGTGWRLPAADWHSGIAQHADELGQLAEHATCWGGNLTLLQSLLGTPWWPQIEQGVLFLEDVGEHPYRIERALTQLLHAGVLARQKAIILGQFTGYSLGPQDRGYNLRQVVQWLRQQVSVPVLTNLPFGHTPTKVLLPVGKCVNLLLQGKDSLILWGHEH